MHPLQLTNDANLCRPLPRRGSTPNSHTREAHRPQGTDNSIRGQRCAASQVPFRYREHGTKGGRACGELVHGCALGLNVVNRQSRAEGRTEACRNYLITRDGGVPRQVVRSLRLLRTGFVVKC
jgi:hypothetical protein